VEDIMKKILGLLGWFCALFSSKKKNNKDVNPFVITERLAPWVVLKYYEKENYLITHHQAKNLARIILNQAISMGAIKYIPNLCYGA